jgi:hypothetical protein
MRRKARCIDGYLDEGDVPFLETLVGAITARVIVPIGRMAHIALHISKSWQAYLYISLQPQPSLLHTY